MRIAMWSGPRNISTALMRSWENRGDCTVCDEPLYAHYLVATGLDHPGRAETIEHHNADWQSIVDWLTGPIPQGRDIWYQKHMAHHLLPQIDRGWLSQLSNCFLIRDPAEMITSLIEFIPEPRLEDTGLPQQVEIFDLVKRQTQAIPPVIDGRDLQINPPRVLGRLCQRLGVSFSESMLHWPPGIRSTDGAWAPYWYDKVATTTGFSQYRPKPTEVPERLLDLVAECRQLYEQLAAYRIH